MDESKIVPREDIEKAILDVYDSPGFKSDVGEREFVLDVVVNAMVELESNEFEVSRFVGYISTKRSGTQQQEAIPAFDGVYLIVRMPYCASVQRNQKYTAILERHKPLTDAREALYNIRFQRHPIETKHYIDLFKKWQIAKRYIATWKD